MPLDRGPDWRVMAINLHDVVLAARHALTSHSILSHRETLAKMDAVAAEFNRCLAAETVTKTTAAWRFLGTDDSVTTCDCCGRKNLKHTVGLESSADGHVVHYGVSCAASALKWSTKEVRDANKSADDAKAAVARAKMEAEHRAHMAAWIAFLLTKSFVVRDFRGEVDIYLTGQAAPGGIPALRKEFSNGR